MSRWLSGKEFTSSAGDMGSRLRWRLTLLNLLALTCHLQCVGKEGINATSGASPMAQQ